MTTISPQTAKQLRDYAQIYNWPLNILSRARDFTSLGIPFAWHYNDQGRPNTLIPAEKLRYPLSKERNKNNNHDYDEATHQAFHALLCDPDASKTKSATKGGYMQCSTCLDWMTDSGSKLSTIPPTIMLNIENKQTWTKKRTDMAEMPIPTNINTVDIMKISQTPLFANGDLKNTTRPRADTISLSASTSTIPKFSNFSSSSYIADLKTEMQQIPKIQKNILEIPPTSPTQKKSPSAIHLSHHHLTKEPRTLVSK